MAATTVVPDKTDTAAHEAPRPRRFTHDEYMRMGGGGDSDGGRSRWAHSRSDCQEESRKFAPPHLCALPAPGGRHRRI